MSYIMDADYWSHLGANLCFNPLFKTYMDLNWSLCLESPAQLSFHMKPKNMPYYHGPCIMPSTDTGDTSDATHCQTTVSTIMIKNCHGLCHLSNVPIQFGNCRKVTPPNAWLLHNDKFPCYAQQVLQFSWAVYSFQGGHLLQQSNLGTCHFTSAWHVTHTNPGAHSFRNSPHAIKYSKVHQTCSIKLVHLSHSSPRFQTSDATTKFWQLQATIIAQLCLICSLSIVVAIIHPDHDGCNVNSFQSTLKSSGWIIASTNVFYPDLGNTLAGSCRVITAVH
jgi:hypothetical protein